jgi:hypothetical protein
MMNPQRVRSHNIFTRCCTGLDYNAIFELGVALSAVQCSQHTLSDTNLQAFDTDIAYSV